MILFKTDRNVKVCVFGLHLNPLKKKYRRSKTKTISMSEVSADKNRLMRTVVNFRFQIGRDQLKTLGSTFYSSGAHEGRFESSKPCKVLGSYHEYNIPDFAKAKPRDNSALRCNMTLSEYSPPQPTYLKTLGPGCIIKLYWVGIDFSKAAPRSPITSGRDYMPDDYSAESLVRGYFALGHVKRVTTPIMNKMISRNEHIDTTLTLKTSKRHNKTRKQWYCKY